MRGHYQKAGELAAEYRRLTKGLVNDFCMAKKLRPTESFPELKRKIQKFGALTWLWYNIAEANRETR